MASRGSVVDLPGPGERDVADALRAALLVRSDPGTEARHVALMAEAHRAAVRGRRARRPNLGRAIPALVGAAAVVAAFVGGAFGGVLPGPVQDRVASLASHVGLALPHGDDAATTRVVTPPRPDAGVAPTTAAPPTTLFLAARIEWLILSSQSTDASVLWPHRTDRGMVSG